MATNASAACAGCTATPSPVRWDMGECDALIFRHLLQTDATESAFEQAWLLRTLHNDHALPLDVLARRFDRSVSWVSRRLSLVRTLPASSSTSEMDTSSRTRR